MQKWDWNNYNKCLLFIIEHVLIHFNNKKNFYAALLMLFLIFLSGGYDESEN